MKVKFYIMDISRILSKGLHCDGVEHVCNSTLRYEDFVRSATSRQLLKYALWREFKVDLNYESLKLGRCGKPILFDHPFISINIAHSSNVVVCAVGKTPLGIDVEFVRQIEYHSLVNQFFHEKEQRRFNNLELEAGLDQFFQFWTLKESYVKCIGEGLYKKLDSFFIDVNTNGEIVVCEEKNLKQSKKYKFYNMRFNSRYYVSICSEQSDINKKGEILEYRMVAEFLRSRAKTV